MINKLQAFEINNTSQILGGEDVHEITAEVTVNKAKSTDKIHNKIIQYISS
ncbi:MAG: hypothetical protein AAF611_12395 [Bacteroidota bacterium]